MAESEPIHNHVEKNTHVMNTVINKNASEMDGVESNTGERDKSISDKEELIYAKFISGIDPSVLQATSLLGDDTAKEICYNLSKSDSIAFEFIKSELERLRLKFIFMHRLSAFGIAPDSRKGLLDAIKDFKSLQMVALYRRTDTCALMIEFIEQVASALEIDVQIVTRAKTILLTHLSFFLTLLPSTAAATAISIAVLTFHAKCVYSIIRIAKASHTAESTIYESIKRLLRFKGFPKTDFRKFYVIESLVFSFKGFFLINKRVMPILIDPYKTVQNRLCARILVCVQSDYINAIRFQRKYLPLKALFEANLIHLINDGLIAFTYDEKANLATYELTDRGQAELTSTLEFYKKVDEISKLSESAITEDWAVWAGIEPNEAFGITLPLGFLVSSKQDGEI